MRLDTKNPFKPEAPRSTVPFYVPRSPVVKRAEPSYALTAVKVMAAMIFSLGIFFCALVLGFVAQFIICHWAKHGVLLLMLGTVAAFWFFIVLVLSWIMRDVAAAIRAVFKTK